MRSSKSRSRSKSNRNRPSGGNILNRVFDSSGPEGKVRGTPQQIIDKYNQLARDAQLSNDRVATENFQQHAEHYLRMLAEAQREQAERQQQQNQQNRSNQGPGGGQNDGDQGDSNQYNGGQNNGGQNADGEQSQPAEDRRERPRAEPKTNTKSETQQSGPEVIDLGERRDDDTGLVETPESKPRQRRPRRKPDPKPDASAEAPESEGTPQDAAE